MSLCERLSEKCYILGDHVWHRPGLLKNEELTDTFKSSGNVYRLEMMNTITDVLECARKMEGETGLLDFNDCCCIEVFGLWFDVKAKEGSTVKGKISEIEIFFSLGYVLYLFSVVF